MFDNYAWHSRIHGKYDLAQSTLKYKVNTFIQELKFLPVYFEKMYGRLVSADQLMQSAALRASERQWRKAYMPR